MRGVRAENRRDDALAGPRAVQSDARVRLLPALLRFGREDDSGRGHVRGGLQPGDAEAVPRGAEGHAVALPAAGRVAAALPGDEDGAAPGGLVHGPHEDRQHVRQPKHARPDRLQN